MRQAQSGSGRRTLLGWLALAALVPGTWGYVNGGDFRDSRETFQMKMKAERWGMSAVSMLKKSDLMHGTAADRDVNELVGQAVQSLPAAQGDKIPIEVKREVARIAREAIQTATATRKEVIKKGRIGSVEYQVGAYSFETYWETKYEQKGRKIHARRTGLEPFVALKVAAP